VKNEFVRRMHNVTVLAEMENGLQCVYVDGSEFFLHVDDSHMLEALSLCDGHDVEFQYVEALRDAWRMDLTHELGLFLGFFRMGQPKPLLDSILAQAHGAQAHGHTHRNLRHVGA
jgi:hypothetical protein